MEFVTEPETPGTDRRRFLAGAGIGAVALAAALSKPSRALAQAEGGGDTTEGGGDTTEGGGDTAETALEPTEADHLAFAESVELAVAEAQASIAARLGGPAAAQLNGFVSHHRAHAAELATASAGKAKGAPNAAMASVLGDQIAEARTGDALLAIAVDLENTLASTHLSLTRMLEGSSELQLIATILPVESAHAAALGMAAGRSGAALFPDGGDDDEHNSFETQRKAVDPSVFPTEPSPPDGETTTTEEDS